MEEFELEPGEEIIRTVRKHFFVLFFKLAPFVVLALLPFVLFGVLNIVASYSPLLGIAGGQGFSVSSAPVRFILGIYWLLLWMSLFTTLTKFFLTQWIITNTRIVDIRQYRFFSRVVSSFLLIRVQDITTEVNGLFGTLVGFGSLNVETAGRAETFLMYGVQNPEGVRDLIMAEVAALHADGLGSVTGGV
jgi:hypothetical protein